MKQMLIFPLIAAAFFAFTNDNSFTGPSNNNKPVDTALAGKWVLQPVLPSDTAAGRVPVINFNLASKRFTGNTGCNDMSGHFYVKGDSLIFDENFVRTRKMCEGYNEKAFIGNLIKTTNYKIEDGVLQLMHDQTVLSTWKRNIRTTMNKT